MSVGYDDGMDVNLDMIFIFFTQAVLVGVWVWTGRHAGRLDLLPPAGELGTGARQAWPRLSILIPALNEGATIRAALETLLKVDYPDLEVICINDRSTDHTGAVIDEMASRDARIQAIHVKELPAGWLGKTHALDLALARATGEFVLCTDADVHFEADALKRAVAVMEHRGLDHLTLFPWIEPAGFLFNTAIIQAGWVLFSFLDPSKVGTDDCRAPMGVGAFNLLRGEVARRLQPFKRLRMEVIDDIGLAVIAHQSGAKGGVFASGPAVSLEYYAGYGAMLKGLEKNAFALSRYSVGRALAENLFVIVAPLIAVVVPAFRDDWTVASGIVTYLTACFLQFRTLGPAHNVNPWLILFFPVGMILCGIAGLRSMAQTLRRGGITWRGTFYPLDELRRMQVTKLPVPKRVIPKSGL
jgi:glycosyltransferase involved in cell wall biosynthesis